MKKEELKKEHVQTSPSAAHSKKTLRNIAEEKNIGHSAHPLTNAQEMNIEEMQSVIYDLRVHQIELETQNEELLRLQAELNEAQARYFDLYDMAPVGYLIVSEQGIILVTNLTAARILGTARRELINHRISPFIFMSDQNIYYNLRKVLFDSELPQECELRMLRGDNSMFWGHLTASVVDSNGICTARLVLSDISLRKEDEQKLIESEEKYRLLCTSMDQALTLFEIITDAEGMPVDFVFLDINESFTRFFGYTREETIGKKVTEVLPCISQYLIGFFGKIALTGEPDFIENYSGAGDRYYSVYSYSPKRRQFAALVTDVTDRMANEKRITYLSYHDQLTGLYNRRFYEEEMRRLDTGRNLPLSIVMGDINGLKLINDSFGHSTGDELIRKTASIIREGCRADDIIARHGGDEFVIILPHTDSTETDKVIQRIQALVSKVEVNEIGLSISFGYNTKTEMEQNIQDIFRSAEDHMYRHKLKESSIMRSRIIDVIVNILFEKNKREQNHSQRVSEISSAIAAEMYLDNETSQQIKLAGLLHDIGKIGISKEILNSSGKPSAEDWTQIKKHPEIGYRILSSTNEFSDIAVFVLDHHERWDGTGYPNGLKGECIPLAARIISIAEAFDAMTSGGAYKECIGEKEAEEELRNGAGKQFDPEIVSILLNKILEFL